MQVSWHTILKLNAYIMRFPMEIWFLLIFLTDLLAPLWITSNVISEWIVRKWVDKEAMKYKLSLVSA